MLEILPQLLVNALIAGSIYALVSFGLSLTYGLLSVLNFAHGHVMMFGVYLFWFFSSAKGFSFLTAAVLTVLSMCIISALIFRVFVSPFLRLSFLLVFVTTLALSNMLEAIVSMAFGVNVKSLSSDLALQSMQFGSVYITPAQIIIIAITLVLLFAGAFLLHSSSTGRRVRALAEHPFAAQSLGISQRRIHLGAFLSACLLATLAGVLVGYELNIQPTMGSSYTIKAFAAMVLGGLGNLWGTIAGSYLLSLFENLAVGMQFGELSIPAGYKDAVAFVVILVILLFKPEGLFRRKSRRV